jgi:iron complex transport system substrate-binding protein
MEDVSMRLIFVILSAVSLWGAAPQRIVSTAPSITETLFAMGLGQQVVGVTIYCKYPADALKLPKIGTLLKPDVEAIVALRPDLVVVEKRSNHLADGLSRLHIRYVEFDSRDLDTIYAGAREIGKAADASTAAEELVRRMQSELQQVKSRTSKLAKPAVAFLVGHTAGRLEGLVVGGGHSYFSDLIEMAGGTNVFVDAAAPYPKISLEEILSRNPDVILELSGESVAKQEEVLTLWREYPMLRAVAKGRVHAIPPGPFLIPGPRAVEAVRILVRLLHPELKP